MFEWFSANSELITWVVRIVGAVAILVLKLYFDYNRDVGAALAAVLELIKSNAAEIVSGDKAKAVVMIAAGTVYDQYLKESFVGKLLSRGQFCEAAWSAWVSLASANSVARAEMVRAGAVIPKSAKK